MTLSVYIYIHISLESRDSGLRVSVEFPVARAWRTHGSRASDQQLQDSAIDFLVSC